MTKNIITFGTFDVFHIGHLNIIKRAQSLGDKLIVGISTDALNFKKKGYNPVFNENERLEIVKNIKGVDQVFLEESLDLKKSYILQYKADILVMGDDWKEKFDNLNDVCQVIYLPRTKNISSSDLKESIYNFMLELKK